MSALLNSPFVFKAFHFFIEKFLKYKFGYTYEKITPESKSFIVLSNHNTNYDPLMVGVSFDKLLYYVASDHIFRWGLVSSLIKFLVSPIPRIKGKREVQTAKEVLKIIKKGGNVCIFAEGNRSFTGETGYIPESTGKLIKLSGAGMITYRIDGGYFTSPRWAKTLRLGLMSGRMVKEYTASQLEKMSAEEINQIIKEDLYVNAFEEQNKNPVCYKGKRLAEHLEVALYMCPKCRRMDTLKSNDDRFGCSCGLDLKYTPYGELASRNEYQNPFATIVEWSRWQQSEIQRIADDYLLLGGDEPITSNTGQSLWRVEKARRSKLICRGTLALYKGRLVMQDDYGNQHSFDFANITDLAIYSRMVLIFSTTDQVSYEIKSDIPRSALKYVELFKRLKEQLNNAGKRKE